MREAIWRAMLNADMNARYWKELVHRYSNRETGFKILIAVVTSGTVASWGFWEDAAGLWKSLSAIAAVAAIVLPILNYQKQIEQMSFLSGKWGELRIEFEDLWIQLSDSEASQPVEAAYKKFRKITASLQEKETNLPNDQKLLLECFEAVKKARAI